jgi:hypothetical protein
VETSQVVPRESGLAEQIAALVPAADRARVALVVQRLPEERRVTPASVRLDPIGGVLGDKWSGGRKPNPEAMVTLMRWDVACLLGDPASFGDNVFASIDTSAANLPAGTVLRVGGALCVVTAKAHTGCSKFAVRSSDAALALTKSPEWKASQLRGVHLRVLEAGDVAVGDELIVVSRPAAIS